LSGLATGVVAAAVSAAVLYLVFRGVRLPVTILFMVVWGYSAFLASVIVIGDLLASLVLAVLAVLVLRVVRHLVLPLASSLGVLLGLSAVDPLLALVAFLSVFDVYSVFRGPIRMVIRPGGGRPIEETPLAYLIYPLGSGGLGAGDILVYVALSTLLTRLGVPLPVSWAAALLGLAITVWLARRLGSPMPAIPIPASLQLALAAASDVRVLLAFAVSASSSIALLLLAKGAK